MLFKGWSVFWKFSYSLRFSSSHRFMGSKTGMKLSSFHSLLNQYNTPIIDLPFKFRMSPLEDMECDLQETKRAEKGWDNGCTRCVFLMGANPFVLSYGKLTAIAGMIHKYYP